MNKWIARVLILVTFLWAFPDLKAAFSRRLTAESIMILTAPGGHGGGTGFELQYGRKQFTVTNAHVCKLAVNGAMEVHSPFLEVRTIHVLAESPYTDLCLLEPINELPSLKLRFGNFKVKDKLNIWGHPMLRPLHVSSGQLKQDMHWIDVMTDYIYGPEDARACRQPKNRIAQFIIFPVCLEHVQSQLTTAKILPGNSGSPVLDENGKVGGVAFAAMSTEDPKGSPGEIVPWSSLYIFLMNYTQTYVDLTH